MVRFSIIILIFLLGCSKTKEDKSIVKEIYIGGEYAIDKKSTFASFWNNDIVTNLSDSNEYCNVNSINVTSNHVYAIGYNKNLRNGMLWKDKTYKYLPIIPYSIKVINDDVYIVGIGDGGTIMKNDVIVSTFKGTDGGGALDIEIINQDIYVSGFIRNNNINTAVLWKNDSLIYLTDGSKNAVAYSVKVVANDVYVAGYENNISDKSVAKIWKNGIPTSLSDGKSNASLNSLEINGNDIYVGGYEIKDSIEVATIWKNGIPNYISNPKYNARIKDLKVVGNDVYSVGYENVILNFNPKQTARYWINGINQNSDLGAFILCNYNSIFIK
jgi:hypothetical protein